MPSHEQYLGNPNLKKANVAQNFTKKQVSEFLKCAQDPVYFAQKYVKIINLDEGLVPFEMYDFQEKLVNNFHNNRFNICKMPRQSGKSTTVVSYLLHYAIFNDSVTVGILANKAQTARDLLGRLQIAYENLPKWMQQGIIAWNKGSMELENKSKIIAASTLHLLFEVCHSISYSWTNLLSFPTILQMISLVVYILLLVLVKVLK